MQFDVKYMRDGVIRSRFTVGATRRAIVGIYRDWIPYGPDCSEIYAKLPFHYRAAFERVPVWLSKNGDGNDVFRADLTSSRGKPFGSVFCQMKESNNA